MNPGYPKAFGKVAVRLLQSFHKLDVRHVSRVNMKAFGQYQNLQETPSFDQKLCLLPSTLFDGYRFSLIKSLYGLCHGVLRPELLRGQ